MKIRLLKDTSRRSSAHLFLGAMMLMPFIATALRADDKAGDGRLADPFLDKLVGD